MTTLPWYIGGPLIGLMVPLILILREKQLGVSSSLRYIGTFILPNRDYFKYDKKKDLWQVQFSGGIVLAAVVFLSGGIVSPVEMDIDSLYGVQASTIYSINNWLIFLIGGFAVGFGARYADGCTAGHCIMGNSLLNKNSMISTICFFIGGLAVTYFILPNIEIL